jgi:origin recognition complex subunit 2
MARKRPLEDIGDPYEVPDDADSPKPRRAVPQRKPAVTAASDNDTDDDNNGNNNDANIKSNQPSVEPTPIKRKPGRPRKVDSQVATPSALRKKAVVATPIKLNGINAIDTPGRRNNADRSARRKSARALIDRVVGGAISDDEGEEEDIAREIYESSEGDEDEALDQEEPNPTTPPKRGPGRPRKTTTTTTRKRSPTPPRDLPPHEQYFYQNKPGLTKTSGNNLSSLDLLTHDEYFTVLRQIKDSHAKDVQFLQSLHAESFPQWVFELSQGFSPCLYGYGSKRHLLHQFAAYLSSKRTSSFPGRIVVINGYVRTMSMREILSTVGTAVDPSYKLTSGAPVAMAQGLLSFLSSASPDTGLTLFVNSIDAPPLRKAGAQSILAQLANHPQVQLVCSADTPDFHLLWDSGQRSAFNFVFHDCTTFAPFGPEIDVVDEVHELLGRKARRVGGKEGVAFVLRSLPENAKNLFRLLVSEVLVSMDEGSTNNSEGPAVEYRMIYNKAVEEFICSSEMAFRTLLKE